MLIPMVDPRDDGGDAWGQRPLNTPTLRVVHKPKPLLAGGSVRRPSRSTACRFPPGATSTLIWIEECLSWSRMYARFRCSRSTKMRRYALTQGTAQAEALRGLMTGELAILN